MSFQSASTKDREKGANPRTGVQNPVVGQEDGPDRIRDVFGFVVDSPFDLVGLSNVPHGSLVWGKDLGDPHIPGDKVHRGSKDGGSGEEQNSQSGREFHRGRSIWFREKWRGRWSMVEKLGNREVLVGWT